MKSKQHHETIDSELDVNLYTIVRANGEAMDTRHQTTSFTSSGLLRRERTHQDENRELNRVRKLAHAQRIRDDRKGHVTRRQQFLWASSCPVCTFEDGNYLGAQHR